MKTVWLVLRMMIGAIFAYAGFNKLIMPVENFQAVLSQYEVIPQIMVYPAALVLPWIEWISGSLLILGFAPRLVSAVLTLTSFSFMMVLVSTLIIGGNPGLDCGCFGESIHLSVKQVIILDGINFLILLRLFFMKRFAWSLDAWLRNDG